MKAVTYSEYGPPDGLLLREVDRPVPKSGEVLVRIHAVSVNRSDWEYLIGEPLYARIWGLRRPSRHILGSDIAGRVVETGPNASRFKPGDAVFGDILMRLGGFAEYVCVGENDVIPMPEGISFEVASAIPQAAQIAVQGIVHRGNVQAGQKVLINGAGGGAGSFAVQLAKMRGAEVTAVDSADKHEFLRSLGATHTIDYRREDFTAGGQQYDLIFDVIGYRSIFDYPRALKPGGKYLFVGGSVRLLFQLLLIGPLIKLFTGKTVQLLAIQPRPADLLFVAGLHQTGEVKTIIDSTFPLSRTADALRHLGDGSTKGKIVVVPSDLDL